MQIDQVRLDVGVATRRRAGRAGRNRADRGGAVDQQVSDRQQTGTAEQEQAAVQRGQPQPHAPDGHPARQARRTLATSIPRIPNGG